MKPVAPAILAVSLLLAACAAAAPYAPPTAPVPAGFSQGGGPVVGETAWWRAFNDPVLTSLVDRALAQNLDVKAAAARVRQARLQEAVVRGRRGPQVNASASASAAELSANALPSALTSLGSGGPPGGGGGIGLAGETFTTYQLGFDASWELDLFGGQRSANRAAAARSEAAVWSQRDGEVLLAAEVANSYQQYRALQRRLALASETLAAERETQALFQARTNNGVANSIEASRQQRAVAQAVAQRADLAAQAELRLHALAALLGQSPTSLTSELAAPGPAPTLVEVPAGLPSELLQRRPDLRAAERQVAAATADIGVATADLYPKISLTGALQLASRSLSSLIEADSLQDNIGGRVSLPLLGRGRLRATADLRRAQAEEAVLAYDRAVLIALREVEDALSRLEADRLRLAQFQASAAAARDEADTAAVRFRNGLTGEADRLTADKTWAAAEDAQVQAEAAAAQDMVALYKALGGGWDTRRTNLQEASDGR
jgi:NodT family efflux transporter outer membrane factor (OMF) lipoprotein